MKKLLVLYILIISAVSYGQKDTLQLFEPALIKADIDTLISKMKDYHPTFISYYQENNIQSKIDSIKETIIQPVSALDFFRMMQPVVAIDGHTSIAYRGKIYPITDHPAFPFKIIIYNNTMYVKENLTDNKDIKKGSVIETINEIPVNEIIKNLIRYNPGEKPSYKLKSLEEQFPIYYMLVYGTFPTFRITSDKKEYTLKGASWNDFAEPTRRRPKYELHFYDDDIAYLCKRNFHPDFLHFIDSAFTVLAEKKVKYLIIDNLSGGGITDIADTLMSYITDKPYCMFNKRVTRISPLTRDEEIYKEPKGIINDNLISQEYSAHSIDRNNRFTGMTYILTGTRSYSTATSFSASAKCYGTAIVVGEESGQPLVSNGGLDKFVLPNTKLTCYTCLSLFYFPCHNNDTMKGVLPDYYVTPSLDDLLNDKDYVLEYTLNLIRENKLEYL